MNDFKHAVRQFVKHPGFSGIAVLTLALGLGATTAVFTVVRSVILDPLPYPDADRLVMLDSPVPGMGEGIAWNLSEAGYFHFREASRTLEEIGAYSAARQNLSGEGGADRVATGSVSASLLKVLGAEVTLGWLFGPEEDQPGGAWVVVLGYDYWVRAFGADSAIIGTIVELESIPREVIGVMAPGIHLPAYTVDIWVPLRLDPVRAPQNSHWLPAIGRLRPGITATDASAELAGLTTRFPELFPQAYDLGFMSQYGFTTRARPLRDRIVGDFAGVLWILLTAVGLVLVIAAANVGNLFAVRTEARRRELAVRVALGAGRRQILREGLVEGVALAVVAAVLGVLLADAGVRLLLAFAPSGIPRLEEIGLTWSDAGFAAGLAVVAGIVVGLLPLLRGPLDVAALRDASVGRTAAPRQHLVRSALVVGQVALALVLLAAAGLMVRSWHRLNGVEPGFDPTNVATFELSLPAARYGAYEDVLRFYRDLTAEVEALPGVLGTGAGPVPLREFGVCALLFVEVQPVVQDERPRCIPRPIVTPGYFEALGISLRGTAPQWSDVESGTAGVVVTAALARRLWPGEEPIGKGLRPNGWAHPFYRVVGVTDELRADGLDRAPIEAVFYPVVPMEGISHWGAPRAMTLIVRTRTARPELFAPQVRRIIERLDPTVPLGSVVTMEQVVGRSVARRSFAMLLLGIAAGMALVLSVVGLYGVVAYVVRRRTAEIGIRMALGARAPEVAGMVLRDAMILAGGGALLGLGVTIAVSRVLRAILFEVSPTDPLTLALVTVVLVAVTLLASLVPARRAARVDPMEALRYE